MSQPMPRALSTRDRRPSSRYKDYDTKQGKLTMLSQSVGRHETPPTTDPLAAERAKHQAAIAKAHGNTSLPGPLKPLTAATRDSDEEAEERDELVDDEDVDDEAERPLLDYRLEELETEDDRVEWLVQTIKKLGARHNYRDDPEFKDELSLRNEWKHLLAHGPAPQPSASIPGQVQRIRTGETHVVKPQTSGQSSRTKLVRTDNTTLGLDGMRIGAHAGYEYGKPPAPKLTRTDETTIRLDGRVVSPPRALALHPTAPLNSTSSSSWPTSAKRTHPDNPAPVPSKKRAFVPKARFDELLRQKKATATAVASSEPSSKSTAKLPKLASKPVPVPSKSVSTPTLKTVPAPSSKPVAKPVAKPVPPPAPKSALTPATKPVPKPVPKPAPKPTPRPATKPAPAPKPVPKLASKPVLKSAPKPAPKPILKFAPEPHHSPASDVEMHDPQSDDDPPSAYELMGQSFASTLKNSDDDIPSDQGEGPGPEVVAAEQSEEDAEDEQGAEDGNDGQGVQEGNASDEQGTKRQQAQLGAFPLEIRRIVLWVAERIKVEASTICAFADCLTETSGDPTTIFERWLVKLWEEANAELREGMDRIPLKDAQATFIRSIFYSIRNSMKKSAEPLVSSRFGLRRRNADRAERAKNLTVDGNECWLSPNEENDGEIFKCPIIADVIEDEFFKSPNSFGYKHLEAFTPLVSLGTIAFACAIIRNCILSFASNSKKGASLNSTSDKDAFVMYMGMLEDIREKDAAHLLDVRLTITEQYLEAWPQSTPLPIPKMNLNRHVVVDMARLEKVKDMLGDRAPEIEEWDGVLDVRRNGKGKGPMRYGPSGSGR